MIVSSISYSVMYLISSGFVAFAAILYYGLHHRSRNKVTVQGRNQIIDLRRG